MLDNTPDSAIPQKIYTKFTGIKPPRETTPVTTEARSFIFNSFMVPLLLTGLVIVSNNTPRQVNLVIHQEG